MSLETLISDTIQQILRVITSNPKSMVVTTLAIIGGYHLLVSFINISVKTVTLGLVKTIAVIRWVFKKGWKTS